MEIRATRWKTESTPSNADRAFRTRHHAMTAADAGADVHPGDVESLYLDARLFDFLQEVF